MSNSAGRGWPLQTWWTGSLMGFHTKRFNDFENWGRLKLIILPSFTDRNLASQTAACPEAGTAAYANVQREHPLNEAIGQCPETRYICSAQITLPHAKFWTVHNTSDRILSAKRSTPPRCAVILSPMCTDRMSLGGTLCRERSSTSSRLSWWTKTS